MRRKRGKVTRRGFMGGAAAAAAGLMIVPRHVLAASGQTPPNDKLRLAFVGVGGRGGANLDGLSGEDVVALCDVDPRRAAGAFKKWPQAKRYTDYRVMLDEMDKSIDGVVVATPDHFHAVALMAAMKRGKHVYSEKPLAHSIAEVRALMKAARDNRVITQLGNQGHSSNTIRMFCEWIWDGAIGNVHTIHAACGSNYSRIGDVGKVNDDHPVPDGFDWDLWVGPAPMRKYNPMYLPGKWRGWMPFGCGVIGDWVCHVVDPVFWALDLGSPVSIQTQAKDYDPKVHADTFPVGTVVKYQFEAKGKRPAVTLFWRDGAEKLPRPDGLEEGRNVPATGAVVLGDKGGITYGSHGAGGVRIFPEEKMKAYTLPAEKIPRVRGHQQDFAQAVREGRPAGSDFSYGGPLTEIALLGVIATKLLGQELRWDGPACRFTNSAAANALIAPEFRKGWTL
jgi:predicted dehydrogenase